MVSVAHASNGRVAMQTLTLDDDLLRYLRDEPMFSCDADRLVGHGFSSCCDHPGIPGHNYWEGYFHGQPQGWSMPSLNPRTGENIDKPAAPLRLRAFAVGGLRGGQFAVDLLLQLLRLGAGFFEAFVETRLVLAGARHQAGKRDGKGCGPPHQ